MINIAEHIYDARNVLWDVKMFKCVTYDTLQMCSLKAIISNVDTLNSFSRGRPFSQFSHAVARETNVGGTRCTDHATPWHGNAFRNTGPLWGNPFYFLRNCVGESLASYYTRSISFV